MNFFKINPRFRIYTRISDYVAIYKDILLKKSGKGDDCKILEDKICEYVGSKYAICMPQGRVGVYWAIKALIKPGQKVILSPYTIADVINMVICAGAIPVFADTEKETCNIDPKQIESLIDNETGAVMITHLQGLSCNMDIISNICQKHNIPLIEDACQAFGSVYNGKRTGTFGKVGIYSLGMYKNLTAFYGGLFVTSDKQLYDQVTKEMNKYPYSEMSWYKKKVKKGLLTDISTSRPLFQVIVYWIFRYGHLKNIKLINRFVETELDLSGKETIPEWYLRRLTPMQARLALKKFDKVDDNNRTRIRYAQLYYEGLKNIPGLILPPLHTDGSHIYTYFPIQYQDRKTLVRWMIQNKCDVAVQHLKNTADLPSFEKYFRDCPNARKTANEVILLPTYPTYGENMIKHNIKIINNFFLKEATT